MRYEPQKINPNTHLKIGLPNHTPSNEEECRPCLFLSENQEIITVSSIEKKNGYKDPEELEKHIANF